LYYIKYTSYKEQCQAWSQTLTESRILYGIELEADGEAELRTRDNVEVLSLYK